VYKDRGFTVVGIARTEEGVYGSGGGKGSVSVGESFGVERRHGVWTKFGIGNAGGGEFLVDAQGNFLAVNATPGEMKTILQELPLPVAGSIMRSTQ
jgi:hypothetical protein